MPPVRLDALRRAFWALPASAMALGLVLGFGLVELDYRVRVDPGVFTFVDLDSARALLQTIATVTVSVAGLAFSVTVVALQLASQQLSPRVLRTFENDRLAQGVLAAFVGTFVYALIVLAKLTEEGVPVISMTIAILAAILAFAFFVAFVHHIVTSLKASTIIRRIHEDGLAALEARWPARVGAPAVPEGLADSGELPPAGDTQCIAAREPGFVAAVDGAALIAAAQRHDVLVVQQAAIGEFVITGAPLATVVGGYVPDSGALRKAFSLAQERTTTTDIGFPFRQLADVALRALSPTLNDPTTASMALDVMSDLLVRHLEAPEPCALRADETGTPRVLAVVPEADELAQLCFEELVAASAGQPVFARCLLARMREVQRRLGASGRPLPTLDALCSAGVLREAAIGPASR